jgi:hypothetical protein
MRWIADGGIGSGGDEGGSSVREVRCQAPTTPVKISGVGAGAGRHAARASTQDRTNRGRFIGDDNISHDATIGVMGKFKPVRASAKKTTRPQGAAGCVILILLIMVGVMAFLYLVMKSNANG